MMATTGITREDNVPERYRKRLSELLHEYRTAGSEREIAEITLRIWNECGVGAREQKIYSYVFLAEVLGVSTHDAAMRLRLVGPKLSAFAGLLWDRIEKDMTLKTAVTLAGRAQEYRRKEETETEAIGRVLVEYDALPFVKKVSGSDKVIRQGRYSRLLRSISPRSKSSAKKGTQSESVDKSFKGDLHALIRAYIGAKLADFDDLVLQREVQRFETDLRVLLEELSARLYERNRHGVSMVETLSRRRLLTACQELGIAPPKASEGPTTAFMKKARRQFKLSARQYHPDASGIESTRPRFEAVMAAWKDIEIYEAAWNNGLLKKKE